MKFSAIILAVTCLAGMVAAVPAIAAPVVATIYETYDNNAEDGFISVTNNSAVNFTDVVVNGSDLGSLAAGSNTPLSPGFGDPEGDVGFTVTISAAGQTISQGFTWSDYDNFGTTIQGTVSADLPEPASIAVFGSALMGLGLLRRRKA